MVLSQTIWLGCRHLAYEFVLHRELDDRLLWPHEKAEQLMFPGNRNLSQQLKGGLVLDLHDQRQLTTATKQCRAVLLVCHLADLEDFRVKVWPVPAIDSQATRQILGIAHCSGYTRKLSGLQSPKLSNCVYLAGELYAVNPKNRPRPPPACHSDPRPRSWRWRCQCCPVMTGSASSDLLSTKASRRCRTSLHAWRANSNLLNGLLQES